MDNDDFKREMRSVCAYLTSRDIGYIISAYTGEDKGAGIIAASELDPAKICDVISKMVDIMLKEDVNRVLKCLLDNFDKLPNTHITKHELKPAGFPSRPTDD